MSRKWERMVRKNTKTTNKMRVKSGSSPISSSGDNMEKFLGRNWIIPLLLLVFVVFFMTAFTGVGQPDNLYYVTIISYFVLALFIFFVRRPFLKIGKTQISSNRLFGVEKYVQADDIDQIAVQAGSVTITIKGKRAPLIFSKVINRYPIDQMADRLKQFAENNHVAYQRS